MSKKYSSKAHSVVLAGQFLTGFGPDDFIEIAFNGEGYSQTIGSDGEVAINEDADESATVTINLLQTSQSNEFLSSLYKSAKEGGQLTHDFLMRDTNGKTLYSSADAVVKRVPDSTRAKAAGVNAWQILCGHLKGFEGGSH